MKKALFVTWDKYPNGDAGAVRTHVIAKILQSIGYQSTVAGMGETTHFKFKEFDNVSYVSMCLSSFGILSRIKGRLQFHKNLKHMLFNEEHVWDVIVVSSVPLKTLNFLKRYSINNSIPLLHDSVEWYSPEQFSIGKLHPVYIAKDQWNRRHIDKYVRVIAISTFLENYFKNRNIMTTRIPAIMDIPQITYDKKTDPQKIVFVYAGSPGKKDYLNVVIQGFATLENNIEYEFNVLGITKNQLVALCGVEPAYIEKLGDKLCCMGRVPRERVLQELKKADFTILMRSSKQRYAKAGFPTKFVESLATATPVIANLTSDLHMYLKDGENGYAVPDESADSLAKVLMQALELTHEERCNMQKKARESAEIFFDYRQYVDSIELLLNQ